MGGKAWEAVVDRFQKKTKKKKQIDISHVITRKTTGPQKKKDAVFHDFVDAARFAGGARSLERRAVTGAWPRLFDRCWGRWGVVVGSRSGAGSTSGGASSSAETRRAWAKNNLASRSEMFSM
jgi:hypothetical protein